MLTVRSRAYVVPALLFLGAAFALANGLGYGSGNLRQYLLHGLHGIDANFLASDWFTTGTRPHHRMFNRLIVLLAETSPLEIAFAFANAVFAAIFVVCIHLLAAKLYRRPIVITALTCFLVIFIPRPYLGLTSILSPYFQPSVVGAVGLLAGLTCMIYGRYRSAGAIFLIAGVFHINYMVWTAVIVGAVVAIDLNRIGFRRALFLLVPIGISVTYHLPFIAASRSPEQLACSPMAARILHDIYMPYHSRPLTWGAAPFLRFGAMLIAGVVAWTLARPRMRHPDRILIAILTVIAWIVAFGIVQTAVVQVDLVALLFPYRLAPFLILAAQIAMAGAIVTTACDEPSLVKVFTLWAVLGGVLYAVGVNHYGLTCLGAFAAALLGDRLFRERTRSRWVVTALFAGMVALLHLGGAGRMELAFVAAFGAIGMVRQVVRALRGRRVRWLRLAPGAGLAVPLCVATLLMRIGSTRKDLAGPPPPPDARVLYDWCRRQTSPEDVFIIPPDLMGFRLGAERPVVTDWKCMPILPKDTIEWYRRVATICGRDVRGLSDARAAFAAMDLAQALQAAREFGARYLVVDRSHHRPALDQLRRVFVSDAFEVLVCGDSDRHRRSNAAESAGRTTEL